MGEIIQKDLVTLDVDQVPNFDDKDSVKSIIITLLNVVEQLLKRTIEQKLGSLEIGERPIERREGQTKIAPNVPPREPKLPSPETTKKWSKDSKKPKIKIDRVVLLKINPDTLPPDVVHKGYSSIIVQNIRLKTDNVEYRREHYPTFRINGLNAH